MSASQRQHGRRGGPAEAPTRPEPHAIPVAGAPLPGGDPSERYALERELAVGGMGRIFAARDRRLGRPVAVKVLLERSPRHQRRFEREALIAARLQHPGIVSVTDTGTWPTGEPYLVMNLVLGRAFDRVIAEAETLEDRLSLLPHLVAAADAMSFAHDRGIIHRDLKPQNILVGAFGETVVVDWGLAKDLHEAEISDAGPAEGEPAAAPGGLSRPGAVLGTPAYMSPEQADGRPVDARTDVYALGAILYQTLSGTPPHVGDAGGATTEIVERARSQAPPPLATLEPRVPPDLVAIVNKALDSDPARRYPSAFELAEDLKRLQTGQLVAARRYSALDLIRRRIARHPVAAAVIALGLGLLAWRIFGSSR